MQLHDDRLQMLAEAMRSRTHSLGGEANGDVSASPKPSTAKEITMTTQDSITVDSFASMDDDCPIETRVACGETQLFLGTRTRSLTLVLTEKALANLAAETTQALSQLRPTARKS